MYQLYRKRTSADGEKCHALFQAAQALRYQLSVVCYVRQCGAVFLYPGGKFAVSNGASYFVDSGHCRDFL